MAEDTQRGGYTSFSDMFDGGGPGASGGPFKGGGLLSAVGNVLTGNRGMGVGPEAGVGFAGYGYNDASGNWVPASVDMRNGGGPGMAGPTFQGGGMYSGILNLLGIRPMGYNDTSNQPSVLPAAAVAPPAAAVAPAAAPRNYVGSGATPATAYGITANRAPVPNSTYDFVGFDRLMAAQPAAPTVPAVPGVNAPLVSGAPDLDALRAYLGSY